MQGPTTSRQAIDPHAVHDDRRPPRHGDDRAFMLQASRRDDLVVRVSGDWAASHRMPAAIAAASDQRSRHHCMVTASNALDPITDIG